MAGPTNGKCGLEDRCCFNVMFSKEQVKATNNQVAVSCQFPTTRNISEHSQTCSVLGASSRQLTTSMVYHSQVAQRMVSSCQNVNVPEIMQTVEQGQGASTGPSRSTQRWGTACVRQFP
jgi:hypothetical protein